MFSRALRIGRLFGIPIQIDLSWLLIFGLVTVSLAAAYFPGRYPEWSTGLYWGLGLVTSLAFFASVLTHELAHSLVARSQGQEVSGITLFIFGGVSQLDDEPESAGKEFWMALVGPLSSLLLSGLFGVLFLLARGRSEPVSAFTLYLGGINLSLGIFNLIPGFPLDGGRVLRALIWRLSGNLRRATFWAAAVGQGIAYLFIGLGVLQLFLGQWANGLWIAFIGWFLDNAARTSYQQVTLREALQGHRVGELMNTECYAVGPALTLQEVVDRHILVAGRRCLSVVEDGRLLGLLTLAGVTRLPRERWAEVTAAQAAQPLDSVKTVTPGTGLWPAMQDMAEDGVNQLPVVEDGRLVGMLSRDRVLGFIRTRAELDL